MFNYICLSQSVVNQSKSDLVPADSGHWTLRTSQRALPHLLEIEGIYWHWQYLTIMMIMMCQTFTQKSTLSLTSASHLTTFPKFSQFPALPFDFAFLAARAGFRDLLGLDAPSGSTPISCHINWLVVDLPLWKIWVRQLGWWHSQYMEKIGKKMFQTTNQLNILIILNCYCQV